MKEDFDLLKIRNIDANDGGIIKGQDGNQDGHNVGNIEQPEVAREKNKKLEEYSSKIEKLLQDAKKEYENLISNRMVKYQELITEIQKFTKILEEGDLDTMIRIAGYSEGSFQELNSRINNVRPYKDGIRHSQIVNAENKINSKYITEYDGLMTEAKKDGIELPDRKSIFEEGDQPFEALVEFDKENGQLLDSFSQKGKELDEKIKERATETIDNKIKEIDELKQEYNNMPEMKELDGLNKSLDELNNKKTGLFFTKEKKDEQLRVLRDKIYTTDSFVKNFIGDKRNKIGQSLTEFEDKFTFVRGLLNEEKYKSAWIKLNSLF